MPFNFLSGRALVFHHEAKVMQAGPLRTTLAAGGAFGEMQQRKVHHTVRQGDGVANRSLHFGHALELEDALVKGGRLLKVRNLYSDVSDLGHGALRLKDVAGSTISQCNA